MDDATAAVAAPTAAALTACGVCASPDLVDILYLGEHPVPNRYPDPGFRWPLSLRWCEHCWLPQASPVAPDGLLYGPNYAFRTGSSSAPHMQSLARWITRRWPEAFVVEVGCNDGTLLHALGARGHPTGGVDPSAPGYLDRVWREPLTAEVAAEITEALGPAGVVVATNVLAHVADVHALMDGVTGLLAQHGVLVAEVQYWPDLVGGSAFDCCYHEHRYHWTVSALVVLLQMHGLRLLEVEQIPQHGGSLRIVAERAGLYSPDVLALLSAERRAWAGQPPPYLQPQADRLRTRLGDLIAAYAPVDALGASAKLVTLLAWCDLADAVAQVLDQTPAKQGHTLPGTQIPVADPSQADTSRALLLGAWSYLPQILRGDPGYFDGAKFTAAGGHFLLPLPIPTII